MYQTSVIIPTYNRPKLLREALNSVFSQEGVELDVIVVDDGATDATQAVTAEFPGVRYVRQSRQGPNAARNHGISLTHYDNVALLDDDDLWLPNYLHIKLSALDNEPDAGYIFSDFCIMKADMSRKAHGLKTWGIASNKLERLYRSNSTDFSDAPISLNASEDDSVIYNKVSIYNDLLEDPLVLPSTAIFRKSKVPTGVSFIDDDFICGDWEFFARLSRYHPALFMPIDTTVNRSHNDGFRLTRTPEYIQLAQRQRMVADVWESDEEFMTQHSDRVHALQAKYHLTQAKLALREREYQEVRSHINEAVHLGAEHDTILDMLRILSPIPGGLPMLRAAEHAARQLRSRL